METVTTFQRARSEEQRAVRREAILAAATAMLAEKPVAEVTLNELARRTGLAKSNVLRYFESREAVLLELLDAALGRWIDVLQSEVARDVDPAGDAALRIEQIAAGMAATLARQPVLCDLISAQASVLEHNVSASVAARYKRSLIGKAAALGAVVSSVLPEIGDDAFAFGGASQMFVGALWPHTSPSTAMLDAYDADPELAAMRLDFHDALRTLLAVMLTGLLARAAGGTLRLPS